jgi:pimeloyl-ACP methyl ester carboxylesterase
MATYVLIHGAGDVAFYWHLVQAELQERGHDVVTMDLPADDESAGLAEYADTVIEAVGPVGDRTGLIVVAQSFGGYTAPIVCSRVPASLLVLVAGMIPSPGESASEMFANTGYQQEEQDDPGDIAVFLHDVDPDLAREALSKGRNQAEKPFEEPWPLEKWPDLPTRYVLCRNDRLFPPEWTRRVVRERLGITPDEIDSGHCPALSRPRELADLLETYRTSLVGASRN